MDNTIYPNAVIVLHFGGLAVYRREDGFIGCCDKQCGDLGCNPMLPEDEMVSIEALPLEWQKEISKELKETGAI